MEAIKGVIMSKKKKKKYKVTWKNLPDQEWETIVEAESEDEAINMVENWDERIQENISLTMSVDNTYDFIAEELPKGGKNG